MRSISRAGRPGIFWILLSGRREGSASAFRTSRLCQRTEDVVHIVEDIRIDVLFGERKGLERGVGVAEDLKAVSDWENGIGSSKLVRSIKSIAEPKQDVVVHDQRLHLTRFLRNNAHSGLVLPHFARSDLPFGPLDVGKHHIA